MSSQEESQVDHYNPSSMPSMDMQIELTNKKNLYKNSSSSQQDSNSEFWESESSMSNQSSGSDYMRNIKMNNKEKSKGRRPNPDRRNNLMQGGSWRSRGRGRGRGRGTMRNQIQAMDNRKSEVEEKRSIRDIFLESEDELDQKNKISDSQDSSNDHKSKINKMMEKESDEDQGYDSQNQQKEQMLQSLKQRQSLFASSEQDEQSNLSEQEKEIPKSKSPFSKQSYPIKIEDAKSDHINLQEQLIQMMEGGSELAPEEIERRKIVKQEKRRTKIYSENFADYKMRRIMKYINGKLDVNVRYLHELVYDCFEEDLICEELMLAIKNMGLGNSLEFIQKYNEEKLAEFDFRKVKFTIFDHRRLVKLLKQKGTKKQYTDEKQLYFMPYQLHVFMGEVYALPEDAYDALCYSMDEAYNLTWWKTIGTELKGKQPLKQLNINQEEQGEIKHFVKKVPKRRKAQSKPDSIKKEKETEQARNKNKKDKPKNEQNEEKDDQIVEDQKQMFKKLIQDEPSYLQSSAVFDTDRRKSLTEKSSLFSSSIFDTEKLLNSDFSMDSNTHSLSDLSDLIGDSGPKATKKKGKNTKEQLEQKEMQKVKKTAANLKKLEQGYKNPTKVRKQTQPKKQQKKPRKKTPNPNPKQKKEKKQVKRKLKQKPKSEISSFSSSHDISNSQKRSKKESSDSDSLSI